MKYLGEICYRVLDFFLLSSNSSSIYLILCEYTIQEISSFTFYNINPLTEAPYFAFVCGNPLYTKKPFNIFTHTHCNYRWKNGGVLKF